MIFNPPHKTSHKTDNTAETGRCLCAKLVQRKDLANLSMSNRSALHTETWAVAFMASGANNKFKLSA